MCTAGAWIVAKPFFCQWSFDSSKVKKLAAGRDPFAPWKMSICITHTHLNMPVSCPNWSFIFIQTSKAISLSDDSYSINTPSKIKSKKKKVKGFLPIKGTESEVAGMISATSNMKTVSDSSTVMPGEDDDKKTRIKNRENLSFHHFQQFFAWREFLHLCICLTVTFSNKHFQVWVISVCIYMGALIPLLMSKIRHEC